ncbi:hypothetical protein RchiOBHm_Chr7g0242321 [Rosa chinensis]|uniref:Uncharacterized protein n=1 Tax=Rosa chinensis TaxID=74649 RepID=A0A2P6PIG6_ROSCH|nr:uncharacterized protein LOC112178904 [Rosa chinensis]PRQ21719.1 hypothetical protein RchiOBHm_Chr7g0242321 [Rosa chinensis]
MENLRIRSKKIRPDSGVCKKHPKHQQPPGVCSICLKEKLTKLSNSSGSSRRTSKTMGSATPSTTSSLSSYYSSTDASSCSSPPAEARNFRFADHEREKGSSVANWLLGEGGESDYVLKKSRSLANYFPRRQRSTKETGEEKKSRRFWSRLLRPISKRKEDTATLVHSRTVREVRVPNRVL